MATLYDNTEALNELYNEVAALSVIGTDYSAEINNLTTAISNLQAEIGTRPTNAKQSLWEEIGLKPSDKSHYSIWTELTLLAEQITCLRGDTKILMADGTLKDIKDVKYGDMIKSYDIDNKCLIDVKSYGAYCTGFEQFWNLAGFTNGSTLYIGSNGHYIFHPYEERLRKSHLYPVKGKVYTSSGDTPLLVGRGTYNAMQVEERYDLLSENGLYFANDILVGHMIDTTYRHYLKGAVPLNEEEIADITADIELYKNYKAEGLNNPEFLIEAGKVLVEANKRRERIEKNKKRLADLDYKQVKRNQGKLSDEEYERYLSTCELYRAEINSDEAALIEEDELLNMYRQKHNIRTLKFKDEFLATYHKQMERIRTRHKV